MSLENFVAFSSEVTGFAEFDLLGTGQADSYLHTVTKVVGERNLTDLLVTYLRKVTEFNEELNRAGQLNRAIFDDPRLGPLAQQIIKLWYCGVWFALPPEWTEKYGISDAAEGTFTASPQAYAQGLLWYTIGANPPGARAPGYGSWASPPQIPALPPSPIPASLIRSKAAAIT